MNDKTITEQYAERIIELEKQVEEMQKALEWYADENNHNVNVTDQWEPVLPIVQDKGNRARACLKGAETE